MTIVGVVAVVFCVLGAIILGFYNEKKVMATIDTKNSPMEEASSNEEAPAETAEEAPAETAEEAPVETAEEAPVETAEEAPTEEQPTVEEIEQEVMAITEEPVEEPREDEEDSGRILKFPDDEEGE